MSLAWLAMKLNEVITDSPTNWLNDWLAYPHHSHDYYIYWSVLIISVDYSISHTLYLYVLIPYFQIVRSYLPRAGWPRIRKFYFCTPSVAATQYRYRSKVDGCTSFQPLPATSRTSWHLDVRIRSTGHRFRIRPAPPSPWGESDVMGNFNYDRQLINGASCLCYARWYPKWWVCWSLSLSLSLSVSLCVCVYVCVCVRGYVCLPESLLYKRVNTLTVQRRIVPLLKGHNDHESCLFINDRQPYNIHNYLILMPTSLFIFLSVLFTL